MRRNFFPSAKMLFAILIVCSTMFASCDYTQPSDKLENEKEVAKSNKKYSSKPSIQNHSKSPMASSESDPALVERYFFLREASPLASPVVLSAFARKDDPLGKAGIDANNRRLLQFFAQTAVETGGWRSLSENMNYSEAGLLNVFPTRVSADDAKRLARKPKEIALHVYSGRYGNRPGTDDGWVYRGAGFLQLTFRGNYIEAGDMLNLPIEDTPEQVRQPELGLDTAIAYWLRRELNSVADVGSHEQVRRAINGGTNGLNEAKIWHAKILGSFEVAEATLPETGPTESEDRLNEAVADMLSELGILSGPRPETGGLGKDYTDALKKFQVSRGLKPTGFIDTETLYAITDPYGRFEPLSK